MEMKVWLPRALHGAGVSWLGLLPRGSRGSSLSLSCFRQRRGCLGTDGGTRPAGGRGGASQLSVEGSLGKLGLAPRPHPSFPYSRASFSLWRFCGRTTPFPSQR